jgi:hypothetical protein
MGLLKLNEHLNDPTLAEWFQGIFPKARPSAACSNMACGALAGSLVGTGHSGASCGAAPCIGESLRKQFRKWIYPDMHC